MATSVLIPASLAESDVSSLGHFELFSSHVKSGAIRISRDSCSAIECRVQPLVEGLAQTGNINISNNTIADVRIQFSPPISVESGSAQSNRISNTAIGIESQGSTVTGNQIMNTGFAALVFECSDKSAVSQNTLNDATMAFYDGPQAATTGNQLDNIDTIATAPNCH